MVVRAGSPWWLRVGRVGFATAGVVALAWIPLDDRNEPGFSIVNHISLFTHQSNLLGVVVLLVGGVLDPDARRWHVLRGASTLYLVITALVYATLLAPLDTSHEDQWVNDIEHRILPLAMLADWLLVPGHLTVTAGLISSWLAYPAAFAAYALLRGPVVNWYPYPFLDPRQQGYLSLALGLIPLTAVFAVLATGVAATGVLSTRLRSRFRP